MNKIKTIMSFTALILFLFVSFIFQACPKTTVTTAAPTTTTTPPTTVPTTTVPGNCAGLTIIDNFESGGIGSWIPGTNMTFFPERVWDFPTFANNTPATCGTNALQITPDLGFLTTTRRQAWVEYDFGAGGTNWSTYSYIKIDLYTNYPFDLFVSNYIQTDSYGINTDRGFNVPNGFVGWTTLTMPVSEINGNTADVNKYAFQIYGNPGPAVNNTTAFRVDSFRYRTDDVYFDFETSTEAFRKDPDASDALGAGTIAIDNADKSEGINSLKLTPEFAFDNAGHNVIRIKRELTTTAGASDDFSGFTTLSFDIKVTHTGPLYTKVYAQTNNYANWSDSGDVLISNTDGWTTVSLPVSSITGNTVVNAIGVQFSATPGSPDNGVIYIDKVRLTP